MVQGALEEVEDRAVLHSCMGLRMRADMLGVRVRATKDEMTTEPAQRDGELHEQAAGDRGLEGDGDEHRDQREGGGDDREGDLAHALERRVQGFMPSSMWR
jgi:hypothetical protein